MYLASTSVSFLVLVVTIRFAYIWGDTYNVAVIEYAINLNDTQPTKDILEENTRNYLKLIEDVAENQSQPLDLIVFPESTLTPYFSFADTAAQLPNTSGMVLCNSTDDTYLRFLKDLSCAAIRHSATIVINFTEKDFCDSGETGCPDSGETFYNTNVAFGTDGTIIARYRKWNLFGEYGKSKPHTVDLPVITIKNTTFGMMTCFDIQFGIPAFNLTREKGVKNVIFPLNWISELPYLTALQVEQMWAEEFNVVLLASGASLPKSGAGGSGIFFGKQGPMDSDILSESGTKVMVQSVPTDMQHQYNISQKENSVDTVDSLAASMDNFYMLVDPSIIDHKSITLNATEQTINATVCHGEENNILCCDFNVSISPNQNVTLDAEAEYYTYHLVAFNGVRTYSKLYYGGIETCGIIACLNDSIASCGRRFSNYTNIVWPLTFDDVRVQANFTRSDQRVQFPTTLLSSIRPLPIQDYLWERSEDESTIITRSITLRNPQNRLLAFGIFGRDFQRDWDPIRNNTSTDNFAVKPCYSELYMLINLSLLFFLIY